MGDDTRFPDRAVAAAGKMSEALETIERARGHLYSFHQLVGEADLKLDEALALLREAGADGLADEIERNLVGRNVIAGRWTFQVVEEFDDDYWSVFRTVRTRRPRRPHGRPPARPRGPDEGPSPHARTSGARRAAVGSNYDAAEIASTRLPTFSSST